MLRSLFILLLSAPAFAGGDAIDGSGGALKGALVFGSASVYATKHQGQGEAHTVTTRHSRVQSMFVLPSENVEGYYELSSPFREEIYAVDAMGHETTIVLYSQMILGSGTADDFRLTAEILDLRNGCEPCFVELEGVKLNGEPIEVCGGILRLGV